MRVCGRMRSKRGFGTTELLIVGVILAILAAVSVPVYRKMKMKAKRGEVMISLGAIYQTEVGFFAENATYGNVLNRIGFDLSAIPEPIYTVGFSSDNNCTPAAAQPSLATEEGERLNEKFPDYFVAPQTIVRGATIDVGVQCGAGFASTHADKDSFIAGGWAFLDLKPGSPADAYLIDQTGRFTHLSDGLQ